MNDIWAVLITHFFNSISPGPVFLFSLNVLLKYGLKATVYGLLGLMTSAFVISFATLGLGEIINNNLPSFLPVFKIVGGLYIFYTGLKKITNNKKTIEEQAGSFSPLKAFSQIFTVSISNPSAFLFCLSVIPDLLLTHRQYVVHICTWFAFGAFVYSFLIMFIIHKAHKFKAFLIQNTRAVSVFSGIAIMICGLKIMI